MVCCLEKSSYELPLIRTRIQGVEVIFASTANDTVENTTTKTAFAPSGVGSAIISANSLVVGQVIEITVRGWISTA